MLTLPEKIGLWRVIHQFQQVNKYLYIAIFVAFYILSAFCALAALGTSVSLKYEVDEAYTFIDMNKSMPPDERKQSVSDIENKSKRLHTTFYLLSSAAVVSFLSATGLAFSKRKLVSVKTED